ncbi:hypothetical protein POTOM_028944 [Populus tomentosa]|uniref:Uncharacterized protein n=1 Tax=Populus tomentosa TaxID=118781 RepID=A0A8X7ZD82_POPTO|nr:hypothetical protein POTOM_028944 [Populus tomentosa]
MDVQQKDYIQRSSKEGMAILIGIGDETHIKKAIINKNARIGRNVMEFIPYRCNIHAIMLCKLLTKTMCKKATGRPMATCYIISGGIVVVLESAVIPDGGIL